MTHASLFSGIGGAEVAASMMGWDNIFHCEINPFCRRVLEYWFPNSKSYEDITKTHFDEWRGKVDILTGGFPCQPFSYAGQRRGAEDDRYLWPHMLRAIQECRPTWVIGENVAGIATMVEQSEIVEVGVQAALFGEENTLRSYELRQRFTLERVCTDLEHIGYSVQPILIPACAVGAPHRRDRIFIVAHTNECDALRGAGQVQAKESKERLQERNNLWQSRESSYVWRTPSNTDQLRCGLGEIYEPQHIGLERNAGTTGDDGNVRRATTDMPSEQGERCQSQLGDACRSRQAQLGGRDSQDAHIGSSTDSDIRRPGASGESRGTQEERSDIHAEQSERFAETQRPDGLSQLQQPHSDSDGSLLEGRNGFRSPSSQPRPRVESLGEEKRREEKRRDTLPEFGLGQRWATFPSVSAIHRGNDGIPFDVDCLSVPFNKWRDESLKAYGNAIVPQVMYEIFRAIEEVEHETRISKS